MFVFHTHAPVVDFLGSLSPLSPVFQLISLLHFVAVGGQLNSLL